MSAVTVWFCHLARATNFLLDQGHHLDPLEARRHIFDEDLLSWMDRRFPQHNLGLSAIPTVDQAEVYERFHDMAVIRTERKYGVQSEGLCVVLAYCIEGLQQLQSATSKSNPDH